MDRTKSICAKIVCSNIIYDKVVCAKIICAKVLRAKLVCVKIVRVKIVCAKMVLHQDSSLQKFSAKLVRANKI